MPENKVQSQGATAVLRAVVAWTVTAVLLLCAVSAVLARIQVGEGSIGYISSVISFLAAVAAGAAVARSYDGAVVYLALLTAAVLVTVLLTVGFIVEGAEIEAAGVISVVSFSFAGCLFGAVFLQGNRRKRKNNKRRIKLT